jgi:hypothetical protein
VSVVGRTEPRLWTPPRRELAPKTSAGFEAATFAEDVVGIKLLPWQRWLFIHALELNEDKTFRFRTVLIQIARQQGKSTWAQLLSLWRLYADRAGLVIGTAQSLDVAEEVWTGAVDMAEGCPELAAEIAAVDRTNGKKALRLHSGERYKVAAASRRGGRGLSGDLVLLDEIREHQSWDAWAAVTKTTMARPKPQIVALSNAGDDVSVVLNHLRSLGLDTLDGGGDPSIGLFEWSAPEDCDLDDVEAWAQANPSLGFTVTEDAIRGARATDPEWIFRTEVLCQRVARRDPAVIPAGRWAANAAATTIDTDVAVFVDVAIDRSTSVIAVCGANADGVPQVEIARMDAGTDWVTEKVAAMIADHGVLAVGARSAGPVASLLAELASISDEADVPFHKVGSGEFSGMCGAMFDAAMTGTIRHRDDARINDALAAAKRHRVVDGFSWERLDVDVDAAPLVAVTGAHAVYLLHKEDVVVYDAAASVW